MQSRGRTFITSQQHLENARIKMGQEKLEKFKRSLRGQGIPTEHLFLTKVTILQGKLIYTKI